MCMYLLNVMLLVVVFFIVVIVTLVLCLCNAAVCTSCCVHMEGQCDVCVYLFVCVCVCVCDGKYNCLLPNAWNSFHNILSMSVVPINSNEKPD
jgi:hypothetical protein